MSDQSEPEFGNKVITVNPDGGHETRSRSHYSRTLTRKELDCAGKALGGRLTNGSISADIRGADHSGHPSVSQVFTFEHTDFHERQPNELSRASRVSVWKNTKPGTSFSTSSGEFRRGPDVVMSYAVDTGTSPAEEKAAACVKTVSAKPLKGFLP